MKALTAIMVLTGLMSGPAFGLAAGDCALAVPASAGNSADRRDTVPQVAGDGLVIYQSWDYRSGGHDWFDMVVLEDCAKGQRASAYSMFEKRDGQSRTWFSNVDASNAIDDRLKADGYEIGWADFRHATSALNMIVTTEPMQAESCGCAVFFPDLRGTLAAYDEAGQ